MSEKPNFRSMTKEQVMEHLITLNRKIESEKSTVERLKQELEAMTPDLFPNGIKDISKVIWAYQMNTGFLEIGDSTTKPTNQQNISNNNAAAFVINKIIPVIFEVVGPNDYKLIDMADESSGDFVDRIFVKFSDASSDRHFNTDAFHISHLGDARFVSKMLSNPIIPPNSGFYVELASGGAKEYLVCISILGYRINIQDYGNLLSYSSID